MWCTISWYTSSSTYIHVYCLQWKLYTKKLKVSTNYGPPCSYILKCSCVWQGYFSASTPPQWIMDRQNGTYVLTTLHWPATICHITLLRASHHIAMHWIFHEDASNWKCQLVHIHRQYWKKVVTFWLATEYDSWPPTVWKIQFDQVRFNVPLDTM